MKNIIRTITFSTLFAAVLFSAASCLEKYPGSSIPEGEAMQTFADAEQHVVGIYVSLKTGNLYSGLLTLLPDIQADLLHAVEGNSNTYGRFWQWDILPTDEYIEAVYGSLYTVIGKCNFYLDRVDAVRETIIDDAELDQLDIYTGEVYAIRALCYSELIKCFCKAYDPATAENELGVVLRTKYFEKEPVVRASLKASYAQVLSDLEKAESLLDEDEDVANNYYMSLAGAYALHARVALYMQNWDDAIKYSTLVLDSDKFVLSSVLLQGGTYNGSAYSEFDSLWSFDSGSEIIWRIGFTPTSYGATAFHGLCLSSITATAPLSSPACFSTSACQSRSGLRSSISYVQKPTAVRQLLTSVQPMPTSSNSGRPGWQVQGLFRSAQATGRKSFPRNA